MSSRHSEFSCGTYVTPDGNRFPFSVARLSDEPTRLYVVLDLVAELGRRLPAKTR